ncbi:unnamed protein product [Microthlaspi erraticum]|uniref:Uncharacterized protein n=1 Tax=Microthlaspi erraticum TaxID=1685480 RepID=A0A6D2L0D7_9BRAS|nr:unnamed protein product [Microthlaspi erraticum]
MEKNSLKLVFLFSLTVIAMCSYLGDAREMAEEEANYIDSPSLAPVSPIMVINGFCHKDLECGKYCPRACTSHGRSCICSYLGDAREVTEEEVNNLGGDTVVPGASIMAIGDCTQASQCTQFCHPLCKSVLKKPCSYLGDAREMAEEEVNYLDGPSLAPVSPIMVIHGFCRKDVQCGKYCPRSCTSHGRACICSCRSRKCHCGC